MVGREFTFAAGRYWEGDARASGFVVSPQENGKEVCRVIGPGSRAMDGSLMPPRDISEGLYSGRKCVFSWIKLSGSHVQESSRE
jgi:hypothetical protein